MNNKQQTIKRSKSGDGLEEAMDLLTGKWTMTIINKLMGGKMRFKELERSIEGINGRMLTKTLRELEGRKIVNRKVYPTIPPTVEYSLTDEGMALLPVIKELQEWAVKNM
ncbi:winged helix-turn-helix transcriptional regulator [Desertivirga brevis]|uniref:winged helix-turn-helix transcriptional regulator n=1 Tax=Desertivirga brevis TaxID=2810310 RepID=UPI001A957F9A|nr:helix-turn-helix domain-containing protein [Pedobacter sp. SYSU D00873]